MKLLEVENLTVSFSAADQNLVAVDSLSFSIEAGKTLTLIGESGCGKSVTSLAIMRLLTKNASTTGKIILNGRDLLGLPQDEMRKLRGSQIAMIFQEPMTALNPVFTVGNQIEEVIALHQKASKIETRKNCLDMMKKVGIADAEERYDAYPHQLSGGLRQRVMIAMALACRPQVLIADEPTTALDVTIQLQILRLIKDLQKELNMGLLLITHDFGVVAETADDVAVMYAGKMIEYASVKEIFDHPKHPYTGGLQRSIPRPSARREKLYTIPGLVPSLSELPSGCRFHERCEFVTHQCRIQSPVLQNRGPGHQVACYHPQEMESLRGSSRCQ